MTRGRDRIANAFSRLRRQGQKGLISYFTAGYPDSAQSLEIFKKLADSGSDFIEIGMPFSDPIADGPVIQRAYSHALSGGLKTADVFNIAGRLREYTDVPVLLMTYYNPVLRAGIRSFVGNARKSGIDGLIVPDLPLEEDAALRREANASGLSLIPLAAPTSTRQRLIKTATINDGFIYCVTVIGVTGSRKEINTDIESFTGLLKKHTDSPLALGFGISGPEAAKRLAPHCDAVVVGSAIVRAAENCEVLPEILGRVGSLTGNIKEAILSADC